MPYGVPDPLKPVRHDGTIPLGRYSSFFLDNGAIANNYFVLITCSETVSNMEGKNCAGQYAMTQSITTKQTFFLENKNEKQWFWKFFSQTGSKLFSGAVSANDKP